VSRFSQIPRRPSPGDRGPVIAIVGGGASGTLAAVHLLRAAAPRHHGLRIALIDRLGRHGLGQAYATSHPDHLLNAPAGRMSALAGHPGHLTSWAGQAGLGGQEFLPRRDFGRYLRALLADAERRAHPLGRVTDITGDVVAIRPNATGRPLRLVLAGASLDADLVVLATGHQPPAWPVPVPGSARCIADPWAPGALEAIRDGRPLAILGTGLTMLDVAIAVTSGNPGTVVHAVSRHGLLPQVHRGMPASGGAAIWLPALADTGPVRLADLSWQVRTAMTSRPQHWQDVVDALRPHVPSLWRRLPAEDQRRFLRHLARYWEVHRHRMAPATARHATRLCGTGRLSVQPGRVTAVTAEADQLRVRVEHAGTVTELEVGWLVNGTGPGADVTRSPDPLLRDLLGQGLARPDPHRLGLDANLTGALRDSSGQPSPTIFTLGPTLRGVRYETTAIPEIRDQSAALAGQLMAAIAARHRPGSAA
jgi:uncharacterized NAD(P)/FAD-binding protein YdhS